MNSDRPLILASGSRYRRELLERLRIPFQVIPADIDETPAPGESGMALAARLGREKAASVAARLDRGLVIGSDQVAELEGRLLGKPGDAGRAFEQLRASSGKTVTFHTSLCVRDAASGEYHEVLDHTEVIFRALTEDEIHRYIESERPFDCAGSFKCEGLGITLFNAIDNQDPSALTGLPLIALASLLRRFGLDLP